MESVMFRLRLRLNSIFVLFGGIIQTARVVLGGGKDGFHVKIAIVGEIAKSVSLIFILAKTLT